MIKKTLLGLFLIATHVSAEEIEQSYHFYADAGVAFGGDTVAQNDNGGRGGDNYAAGGGAVFAAGVAINLMNLDKVQIRSSLGYRYQSGDGSNKGIVVEGSLFYSVSDSISIGAGVYADISSETQTREGEIIKFDNSIAPMALIEWSDSPAIALGLKYINAEYTTDTKVYDGNQVAVYIHMRF